MFTVLKLSILRHFWLSEVDKYRHRYWDTWEFFSAFIFLVLFCPVRSILPGGGKQSFSVDAPVPLCAPGDESEGWEWLLRGWLTTIHLPSSTTASLLDCMLPDLERSRHTFPVSPQSPVLPCCKPAGPFCTAWENHSLGSISSCHHLWKSTPQTHPSEK